MRARRLVPAAVAVATIVLAVAAARADAVTGASAEYVVLDLAVGLSLAGAAPVAASAAAERLLVAGAGLAWLAELPGDLRATIAGPAEAVRTADTSAAPQETAEGRMAQLEDQVASLTEAMRTLAHGLEDGHLAGIDEGRVTRAARLADEILIAAGSRPTA